MSMLIRMFQLDCHAVIYEFHRAIDKGVHGLVVCPFHDVIGDAFSCTKEGVLWQLLRLLDQKILDLVPAYVTGF